MATLHVHDLPPELLHAILAPMGQEPPPRYSLIACSLVSHLWRDIALHYLFSTLRVHRRESFADVIPFLSAHPHIAARVKRLLLQRKGPRAPNPEVDPDTVHALLARLPAVVNLSFHTVAFVRPCPQVSPDPQTAPESSAAQLIPTTDAYTSIAGSQNSVPYRLQMILLYSCTAPHGPTSLFRILSLCEIETFRATLTELPEIDGPGAQVDLAALHRPLRVRWLRVGVPKRQRSSHPCPSPLLEGLRRCLEPGCIRKLDVACVNWDAIEGAGALLRDVGCNLTTLRLDMFGQMTEEDTALDRWGALNVSSCTELETFEFSFPSWGDDPDRSGSACAKIVRLLPAGMQTIVLRLPEQMFEAVPPEYPRTPGLREVEEAVLEGKQEKFPELTRVVLSFVDYQEDMFETWATIGNRVMPRLSREGFLHATVRGRC